MKYRIKLVSEDMTTRNGCKWKLGVWKRKRLKNGAEPYLCSNTVFHCYLPHNFLTSLILNVGHADINEPRMFVAQVSGIEIITGDKAGYTNMKLVKEVKLPKITIKTIKKLIKILNINGFRFDYDGVSINRLLKDIYISTYPTITQIEEALRVVLRISKRRYDEIKKMLDS